MVSEDAEPQRAGSRRRRWWVTQWGASAVGNGGQKRLLSFDELIDIAQLLINATCAVDGRRPGENQQHQQCDPRGPRDESALVRS